MVTGALIAFFAARELADRSDIILQSLELLNIASADILHVFLACIILFAGVLLLVGFWTRIMALALLLLLVIGGYCWPAQDSQLNFQIQALYGILFLYLLLVGGGNWAVSRRKNAGSQSLLEAEQSIFSSEDGPSIFREIDGERNDASSKEAEIDEFLEEEDEIQDTIEVEEDEEDTKPKGTSF